MAKNIF